jgi:hypothetical protein
MLRRFAMTRSRSIAQPISPAVTPRGLLLLIAVAAALALSPHVFGQTRALDSNGAPILAPGQTPTPRTQAQERGAVQQSRDRAIQNRAQQRSTESQRQFQNDRSAAQQRESTVQQNFEQQRLDILNNRDKP